MSAVCLLSIFLSLGSFAAEEEFASKTIHIGMIVSDLEKSMSFFKDVIGFIQDPARKSFDVDEDFGKRSGLTDSLGVHVEVLKLGVGEEATQLKLLHFGDKPKQQKNDFIHTHSGIQYLTIRVTNLTPILERIEKNKVKLLGETPVPVGEDNQFVLIQDPDGTFVELIGPKK
jgi:catechol 2,3-dioxygenase-like lactoylglutathione lyase family enzyme